ncbi:MAG: hypothetical protein ACOY90_02135 [Candidatus Zhuqueibacterota bacterium]
MISTHIKANKKLISAVVFSMLLISQTLHVLAEEPEKPAAAPLSAQEKSMQDKKTTEPDQAVISNDQVKVFLKGIEVYGSIAKPQTVFIIPGTDPRVDGLLINRHFFSHIFRPVEKSTLRRDRIKQEKDRDHILW